MSSWQTYLFSFLLLVSGWETIRPGVVDGKSSRTRRDPTPVDGTECSCLPSAGHLSRRAAAEVMATRQQRGTSKGGNPATQDSSHPSLQKKQICNNDNICMGPKRRKWRKNSPHSITTWATTKTKNKLSLPHRRTSKNDQRWHGKIFFNDNFLLFLEIKFSFFFRFLIKFFFTMVTAYHSLSSRLLHNTRSKGVLICLSPLLVHTHDSRVICPWINRYCGLTVTGNTVSGAQTDSEQCCLP